MANVDHSALVIYNCAEKGEMGTGIYTCISCGGVLIFCFYNEVALFG